MVVGGDSGALVRRARSSDHVPGDDRLIERGVIDGAGAISEVPIPVELQIAREEGLGSGAEFIPRMGGGQENVDPALESAIGNAEPDDEADFEELKRAVDMIAELSLLGGGDAEELWPDDDEMMASAFQEDREWRVAL